MSYAKSPSFIPVCLQDLYIILHTSFVEQFYYDVINMTSSGRALDDLRNGKGRLWPNRNLPQLMSGGTDETNKKNLWG
jgi:hypothetical protein